MDHRYLLALCYTIVLCLITPLSLANESSALTTPTPNGSQTSSVGVAEKPTGKPTKKSSIGLMGNRAKSTTQTVCGDGAPDIGETCDDGNLVDGDGCDATCQIEAGSDCTAAIAPIFIENILGDGSFELNNGSWTMAGTAFHPRCSEASCDSDLASDGSFYLWLGGGRLIAGNGGQAAQTLVIPPNATTLTFEWGADSNATSRASESLDDDRCESPDEDRLEVLIDNVLLFRTPNPCRSQDPFVTETIDLVAAGVNDGTLHTILFQGFNVDDPINPGKFETNFYVDNVQLNATLLTPIPAVPSSCLVGICGDAVLTSGEQCDDGNVIDGDGCSSNCLVEQPDFVCTDPALDSFDILSATTGDAIVHGSFEDGRGRQTDAWIQSRANPDDLLPICTEVLCPFIDFNMASDGVFYAIFGADSDASNTSISQTTTIPATASTLTFDFAVTVCDSASDTFTVDIDGIAIFTYACTAEIGDFTSQIIDISAFADGLDHTITMTGDTLAINGGNTDFFVDNIRIPLPSAAVATPSACVELDQSCDTIETFDEGIPSTWTVVNVGPNPDDGWGTIGDGICLSQNAAGLLSNIGTENLTSGTGNAACADSDATGQVDINDGGAAAEMDTYLCSPELNLSNITGPQFSFNAYYQSADNQFNDNGTPDDFTDDFDEDLMEIWAGTQPPNALTIPNLYIRLGNIDDHEDDSLLLTGAQELSVNLEGSVLEGASSGYVCFHYRGTFARFAQIDNAGLRGNDCNLAPVDTDGDGVFDSTDNCLLEVNPDQFDADNDGLGNPCDADVTQDCIVNFLDISLFPPTFNTAVGDTDYDPVFDFNNSGTIAFVDYFIMISSFGMPPGPSANECVPEQ